MFLENTPSLAILKRDETQKKFSTDFLIVGAGPVGCVLAERISNNLKMSCVIIDKRNHIAGNCYDLRSKKIFFIINMVHII